MSKVIKSYENDARAKIRKFEKKIFEIESGSADDPAAAFSSEASELAPSPVDACTPAELVAEAERHAEELISAARKESEAIRQKANEQGYAEGFAKGVEESEKKGEERIKFSVQALDSLAKQLKSQESEMMGMLSPRLADLATEMTRKIIHREVRLDPSIVKMQAEEAIKKILERDKLIIRVCPEDERAMKSHKTALMSLFDGIDKIEVVGDPSIERGGCIVETHLVKVDAQPTSQLQAARKALQPETEK